MEDAHSEEKYFNLFVPLSFYFESESESMDGVLFGGDFQPYLKIVHGEV